jgi:hypothetical protein
VKKDAGREKRNDEQGYETMPNSKKWRHVGPGKKKKLKKAWKKKIGW